MKRFVAVCCLLLLTALNTARSTVRNPALVGVDFYDPLQHSHLVVRGRILSISVESIVPGDLFATGEGDPRQAVHVDVGVMEIAVAEVLRGPMQPSTIKFLVFPRIDFREGREIVVCAKWFSGRNQSSFVANEFLGLYEKNNSNRWERRVDPYAVVPQESLTDEALRSRLRQASLSNLTAQSDVVARGSIVRSWESSYKTEDGRIGELVHYRLAVVDQLKGVSTAGVIEFVVSKLNTTYVPKWYRDTPRGIAIGEEWIVFLRSGERGLYPFGGVNSVLKVEGGRLLYDMAVTYPLDVDELTAKVRKEVADAQE